MKLLQFFLTKMYQDVHVDILMHSGFSTRVSSLQTSDVLSAFLLNILIVNYVANQHFQRNFSHSSNGDVLTDSLPPQVLRTVRRALAAWHQNRIGTGKFSYHTR